MGEDVAPAVVAAGLPDEEDDVGQGFVEHERLDLELDPAEDRAGHGSDPGAVGPRGDDQGERKGQEGAAEPEGENGPSQAAGTDAHGLQGHDLRIRREPGESTQDAHQDGHRQGEHEDRWDEQAEDADGFEDRNAFVDEQLGQQEHLVH